MPKPDFDISVLGDKQLEHMLAQLPRKSQARIVRRSLRDSVKRLHSALLKNVMGSPVGIRTGRLAMAIASMQVKSKRRRNELRYAIMLPTREELGISPQDKHYYPAVLEYGAPHMPARAPMRRAVDDNAKAELATIAHEIGKGVERTARRLGMTVK